jgi:hypothetical protein
MQQPDPAAAPFIGTSDPFAMSPQMRESMRLQVIDLRALFTVDEQLSAQLLDSYRNYGSSASADARE